MIELKHLTKKYDHFLAVEDLNLKIGDRRVLWAFGTEWCRKNDHHRNALHSPASDFG